MKYTDYYSVNFTPHSMLPTLPSLPAKSQASFLITSLLSPSLLCFFPFLATGGHRASAQNGADINAKDMLKMTALHWAAQHGHREVAELLLRYGADVHCLSKFDKTPFDIAMDTSNTELMILLQVDGRRVGMGRDRHSDRVVERKTGRGKDTE